jgi:uncharacterized protein YdhG (YjbR/CyaY superfamily)
LILKQDSKMNEIDQYIAQFEPEIQIKLKQLRQLFFDVYPDCEESFRYKMPAFKIGKGHLYFAAYKKHIGFYPVYGLLEMEDEISKYRAKGTKDSLHFMHNAELPFDLIKKIIQYKAFCNAQN